MRPNDVDTFNFSIQRQINNKMLIEVGYIGRLIHHEYIMENPNVIPYMMSLGGQSFASAYLAIEGAFGCTTSASLCAKSTTPTATVSPQPFFEQCARRHWVLQHILELHRCCRCEAGYQLPCTECFQYLAGA